MRGDAHARTMSGYRAAAGIFFMVSGRHVGEHVAARHR